MQKISLTKTFKFNLHNQAVDLEMEFIVYKPAKSVVRLIRRIGEDRLLVELSPSVRKQLPIEKFSTVYMCGGFNPFTDTQEGVKIPVLFEENDWGKRVEFLTKKTALVCEEDMQGIYYRHLLSLE